MMKIEKKMIKLEPKNNSNLFKPNFSLRFNNVSVILLTAVLLVLGANCLILNTNAQGLQTGIENIDLTLGVIETKRNQVVDLRQKQSDLEKENTDLNKQIQDIKLEISKTDQSDLAKIDSLKGSLEDKNKKLEENKNEIEDFKSQINKAQQEVDSEVGTFRTAVVSDGTKTVSYLSSIIVIWIVYEIIIWLSRKFLPERTHSVIRLVTLGVAFVLSIIIIIIAFADKLEFLFASIGVVSAALVVALQDLVSSFFAWLLITTQKQFLKNDIIKVGQDQNSITGSVSQIGILRTYLDERIGGLSELDFEQSTGKVISFPNNFIFSEPLINFTKNHPYLWYNFKLTITFESDAFLADKVITEYMNSWFVSHLEIKGKKQREDHTPRVFTHIADDGPCFTIWFASKNGLYRPELKKISLTLLKILEDNNIQLAYKTFRALTEGQKSKP